MAITLRGTGTLTADSGSATVTLPVTTNAGDIIVLVVGSFDATVGAIIPTGAGATWTSYAPFRSGPKYNLAVCVGFSPSVGASTCSFSNMGSTGAYSASVWSGVTGTTVQGVGGNNFGATGATESSGLSAYAANALVIGCAYTPAWNAAAADGAFGTLSLVSGQKTSTSLSGSPMWDYALPVSSGADTFTSPAPNGSSTATAALVSIGGVFPPIAPKEILSQAVKRASFV